MLWLLSRRLFKICESIFFQSDLPAGKLCTTLPIVPKSRDLWSTFGVWHKHIQSYSSQWIIILWTELPKYCLKNRLKMFNFWFFFCSQMFIRWPLVAASVTYTTTIICIAESDLMKMTFSKVPTFVSKWNILISISNNFDYLIWLYWNHQNICQKHWISRDIEHKLIFKAHVIFLILKTLDFKIRYFLDNGLRLS